MEALYDPTDITGMYSLIGRRSVEIFPILQIDVLGTGKNKYQKDYLNLDLKPQVNVKPRKKMKHAPF